MTVAFSATDSLADREGDRLRTHSQVGAEPL